MCDVAGPLKNKDPDEELEVYIQAYEPTLPHAAETGAIAEVDLHCFMTMPFKGLKVFSIKYSDGTTKRGMLGSSGQRPSEISSPER